jgi:FecR protein
MHYRFLFVFTLALWSAASLPLPQPASADVPLKRAIVQDLRNQVRLLLKDQPPRPAKRMDIMVPGDALATARTALAELTFNDKTFARVGEQALFRFQPNTRDFRLDNGTLLLLVPPGQGRTRVRTPNAAAGIRGSALFVRYNPDTNTTLVGALTNSQIEVTNQDGSQNQPLKAGQMAVIVQGRIERVYDFDLNTFYETSELTRGLDLPRRQATANPNPAIAAVQAETAEAIRAQVPVVGQGSIDNPAFVRLSQAGSSAPPALVSDVNRTIPDSLSPVTGVTTNARPAAGQLPPGETVVRVINSGVSGPKPELPPASPRSSPAPLPPETVATPAPPRVPSLPPQVPSERPLPTPAPAPLPPPAEIIVQPAPAPAPLPPTEIIVQPAPAPLPPAEIIVQPAPAPAPLPSPPAAIVQPAPTPALLPPVEIIVQPAPAPAPLPSPPAAIVQPAPAPAPLPSPPAVVVQPAPAPAPLPPTPEVVAQPAPAPAPLPPTPEVVVQPAPAPLPPAPQAIPASIQPLEIAPPSVAPAPAPSVNPAPVTFPSPDSPPIAPTSNPGVQAPAAAKVAPPLR